MKCSMALVFVSLFHLFCVGCAAQEYDVPAEQNTQVFFAGPKLSDASIIFDSSDRVVNNGEEINLDCGVDGKYRYCFWEREGSATFQVEDVIGGMISGMTAPSRSDNNQCGIKILRAKEEDHGIWACKVFVVGSTLVGRKKVIVTVQPDTPVMNVVNPLKISEGDMLPIVCTVASARPQVQFFWMLGSKHISDYSSAENIPSDSKGTYRGISTLTHQFEAEDDMKSLRCGVRHVTLKEPLFTEISLDVRYKPVGAEPFHIYGIKVDGLYKIVYNFSANPRPTEVSWIVDNQKTIPVPGQLDRYTADIVELVNHQNMATLEIQDFTEADVLRDYSLMAKNEHGETSYQVVLSTADRPTELLGGGAIAAIIIVVILVIVTLCIAGFMRYRQMYCFATRAESKAYIKDPERPDLEHNCRTNEAVKSSLDHLNGRPEATLINGGGNPGMDRRRMDAVPLPVPIPLREEKKNTDV